MTRLLTAFAPLLLTPLLLWLISEGYLNFGGGDKDVILLIPWTIWSLFFAVAALIYWWRTRTLASSLRRAAGWATGLVVSTWMVLFLLSLKTGTGD